MAVLVKTATSLAGGDPNFQAATSEGDSFVNTGRTLVHFKNEGATGITVTINSVQKCNFGFDHDVTLTVAAGEELIAGPFATARFGSSVGMTYSAVTSLTVAVYEPA